MAGHSSGSGHPYLSSNTADGPQMQELQYSLWLSSMTQAMWNAREVASLHHVFTPSSVQPPSEAV